MSIDRDRTLQAEGGPGRKRVGFVITEAGGNHAGKWADVLGDCPVKTTSCQLDEKRPNRQTGHDLRIPSGLRPIRRSDVNAPEVRFGYVKPLRIQSSETLF